VPLDGSPSVTSPLPEGWSEPERVEDVVDADGLVLHRAGLASCSGRDQAVGSAADWESSPSLRARFELLERIAVLEASRSDLAAFTVRDASGARVGQLAREDVFPVSDEPARWSYARSNGVALHADWRSACESAARELVERDRVQRAWLGETVPRALTLDLTSSPLSRTRSYVWSAYAFPPAAGALLPEIEVVGVFGFPSASGAPLAFGYGSRPTLHDALGAATREAAQLLAFAWGEPIPERLPEPEPTPLAHLERFQVPEMHGILRRWLDGAHARHARRGAAPSPASSPVHMVDLTPPWLGGGLEVAKAIGGSAIPLTFGESPVFAHLPPELRIHPIP
jgi:ribosomal protein S12 methylthiotransferase accessory factor YcaO